MTTTAPRPNRAARRAAAKRSPRLRRRALAGLAGAALSVAGLIGGAGTASATTLSEANVPPGAPTLSDAGYWMATPSGLVGSFGGTGSYGELPVVPAHPVVGMAGTPDGHGYWEVASDGGVFTMGDAGFYGSTGGSPPASPVTGMMAAPGGGGYWLYGSDGSVYAFGDATPRGSGTASLPAGQSVVGAAVGTGTGTPGGSFPDVPAPTIGAASYPAGATGYDISWPQCGGAYPPPSQVAVVGVNDGFSFSTNPCMASEASWGGQSLSLYINLDSPEGSDSSAWSNGPAGTCAAGDLECESYNWGYNAAQSSVATATGDHLKASMWWLDVETGNYWSPSTAANDQVVAGAIAALRADGLTVSIYSTGYQWGQIAGAYVPGVPVWYPTGTSTSNPGAWCSATSFAGGPVKLVQDAAGSYDGDYSC